MSLVRQKKVQTFFLLIFIVLLQTDSGVSRKLGPLDSFLSTFSDKSRLSSLVKDLQNFVIRPEDNRNLVRTPSSSILVVGGTEADPHQFPFQISLQVRNYFGGLDHNCGGVIYDANHIITAAHCVRGYHPKNLEVVAGEHELFQDVGTEQYRDVLGYVFHPGYEPRSYNNDIAIITLDFPLDLNDQVQPLALPPSVQEYPEIARTSGWGNNGYDDEQQVKLLYVDLDVYSSEQCAEAWSGRITDGMMCAGSKNGEGGRGSCNGDSGGPLICKDKLNKEYLCGLVSWGSPNCGAPNLPTVFVNINNYLDWLRGLLPDQ